MVILLRQLQKPSRYGIYQVENTPLQQWKCFLVVLLLKNVVIMLAVQNWPPSMQPVEEDVEENLSLRLRRAFRQQPIVKRERRRRWRLQGSQDILLACRRRRGQRRPGGAEYRRLYQASYGGPCA